MSFRKILHTVAAAMAVLALALPATALGQTGRSGYTGPEGDIQDAIAGTGTGPGGTAGSTVGDGSGDGSALPFTGLDVALLVGGGALLLTAGLGMRRLARRPDAA
jgi:hypothetical protein